MRLKEQYMMLKDEGKTDKEIAKIMCMARDTLHRRKKANGINGYRRNKNGLTQEQLESGEKIGLSRRVIHQRVRVHGYTVEEAITIPPRKHRKTMEE